MKNILAIVCLVLSFQSMAQTRDAKVAPKMDEISLVRGVIEQLFDGMRAGDSSAVRSAFYPGAHMQTVFKKEGKPVLHEGSLDEFVYHVGQPHEKMWDERIWSYDIRIDGLLATAWTEYTFYFGDQMSHCGVNAFQLFKSEDGWKITQIIDTRRKEGCRTSALAKAEDREKLNNFLDRWHKAAAEADAEAYFGAYAKDGIFLGTDESEHWTKEEFWTFSKPYFDKGKAWSFTAKERHLYFSEDGTYAWFDELLDTWMGTCRGSGVLKREGDSWKMKHYNLALTVPNDKMKEVIELTKAKQ